MEPPGCATQTTPLRAARSMLSPKGKNASEPSARPAERESQSRFSASESSSRMKRSISLSRSARFMPSGKLSSSTFGCLRSRQVSALSPARRVQWMRLCWPAPTPTVWPSFT